MNRPELPQQDLHKDWIGVADEPDVHRLNHITKNYSKCDSKCPEQVPMPGDPRGKLKELQSMDGNLQDTKVLWGFQIQTDRMLVPNH